MVVPVVDFALRFRLGVAPVADFALVFRGLALPFLLVEAGASVADVGSTSAWSMPVSEAWLVVVPRTPFEAGLGRSVVRLISDARTKRRLFDDGSAISV